MMACHAYERTSMDQPRFLSLPNSPIETANVVLLPLPHEHTVSYGSGTAEGPQALLAASEQLEFYEEDRGWAPFEHLRLCVTPPLRQATAETAEDYHRRVATTAAELGPQRLVIGLGGEHSASIGLVSGRMSTPGTVVHIDAHADLRASYQGSAYSHACPGWHWLQAGHRLIQIGVRSAHAQEAALWRSSDRISVFRDRQLYRADGWHRLVAELTDLSGPVYLSIDVDGFDPAVFPSTGTPQPGGLSWHQGLDILEMVLGNRRVELAGADVMELIPDPMRIADMAGAKLVQKVISYWAAARGWMDRPREGSQVGAPDE